MELERAFGSRTEVHCRAALSVNALDSCAPGQAVSSFYRLTVNQLGGRDLVDTNNRRGGNKSPTVAMETRSQTGNWADPSPAALPGSDTRDGSDVDGAHIKTHRQDFGSKIYRTREGLFRVHIKRIARRKRQPKIGTEMYKQFRRCSSMQNR
ncbi:hypothetical protein RRG08_047413 [Elysia crispata]|uniref:Uncharacterized protein n=1 Tax=Elysia crispata TaxID=231223 RepID=A0AAE0YUF1_9GAST|nr:hypothetical protein RRG08_047413 [Elysia crispata]